MKTHSLEVLAPNLTKKIERKLKNFGKNREYLDGSELEFNRMYEFLWSGHKPVTVRLCDIIATMLSRQLLLQKIKPNLNQNINSSAKNPSFSSDVKFRQIMKFRKSSAQSFSYPAFLLCSVKIHTN